MLFNLIYKGIGGRIWGHPVTSPMTWSWKTTFLHNSGRCFRIWGQIEAVFNISKFSKWPPFWARVKLFLSEVIPEVEYTRKTAISISDILSFQSMLYLKYWRRYINFKIWPTLWPGDITNDILNTQLYKCSHSFMIPLHRKFNDDIYAHVYFSWKMSLFNL